MSLLEEQYEMFLGELQASGADLDVRKVASIIQANLGAIAATVSAGGQRANMLTPLVRRELAEMEAPPNLVQRAVAAALPWQRLQTLKIGPFRGFRREEIFDLKKNVTLFYGPNGSGKTSLCEALEFALTGDVEESSLKRSASLAAYFANIHEGRHAHPQLYSAGAGDGIAVQPAADLLRFAIIEKNRIESFARIAARTPAQANELISALFGLSSFNDFVGNFPAAIQGKLNLASPVKDEMQGKIVELNGANERLQRSTEVLAGFDADLARIAEEYKQDCTTAQLRELIGSEQQPGRLQHLIAAADEITPAQSGLRTRAFKTLFLQLRRNLRSQRHCKAQLSSMAGQISFKRLFETVQALQDVSPDACPACLTPLSTVASDPYVRAGAELQLLQHLAVLETEFVALEADYTELERQSKALIVMLRDKEDTIDLSENGLVAWATDDNATPLWEVEDVSKSDVQEIIGTLTRFELEDAALQLRVDAREAIVRERDQLLEIQRQLSVLDGKRSQHESDIQTDRKLVAEFDEVNAELIDRVVQESASIAYELRLGTSYSAFSEAIKAYRDTLPAKFLADLNDTTRDLYNGFNEDDHERDRLASLSLPLRGGERIMVSFGANPEQMYDALHVLSEGHLRCLGLAILLAKNIKLGLPLLVFDDAVNAIDDDHRAGIRKTLFGDARLSTKQIIVTCHGNEFIKDIHNQLGDEASHLYVLGHHAGDHQPRVQGGSSRNYLVRAQASLDEGDQRQCLAFCRQGLENLTSRTWRKLYGKARDLSFLSVPVGPPTYKPELGALSKALLKGIQLGSERGMLTGASWASISTGFEEVLAVPNNQLIWSYFNKGTHDEVDREDFELPAVRHTLMALKKISVGLPD